MQDQKTGTLRGVIYARYSSDNQREESIDGQLRECHDKHYDYLDCKEAGLKVVALEKDQRLQDLVLSIHHSYVLSSYAIPSYIKYIENSRGQTFIISGAR